MSELREYQKQGVEFLLASDRRLLGDDMGLGKTPQACVALKAALSAQAAGRALVVCPASLRINWQRELAIWCPHLTTGIATGSTFPGYPAVVAILSYNALIRWHNELRAEEWAVIIADEAHYMKTLDSQRTKELRGGFGVSPIICRVKWALTGTPLLNRPIELYPILKWLDTPWAPKEASFGLRYCGGYERDFKGATNIPELREKLKTVMLRRLKADVLTELPPKTRQVIELELGADGAALIAEEKNALREAGMSFEDIISGLKVPRVGDDAGVIARLRKRVGLLKVEAAAEHILEVLDSGVEKIIVFAHHRDVIDQLGTHIEFYLKKQERKVGCQPDYVVDLTGGAPPAKRQFVIDLFQNDPQCRVFIGNIQAAGVGITLTAASHVVFVERSWTPGENTQAEDRAHRFGQAQPVLIQHLVLNGSLDAYMARSVVAKQIVLDAILN